jgi:hypothetical protein
VVILSYITICHVPNQELTYYSILYAQSSFTIPIPSIDARREAHELLKLFDTIGKKEGTALPFTIYHLSGNTIE